MELRDDRRELTLLERLEDTEGRFGRLLLTELFAYAVLGLAPAVPYV